MDSLCRVYSMLSATEYGYGNPSGERELRKRRPADPPVVKTKKVTVKSAVAKKAVLKKAGTMLKTAKVSHDY